MHVSDKFVQGEAEARLRRDNRILQQEREILKKGSGLFTKESETR